MAIKLAATLSPINTATIKGNITFNISYDDSRLGTDYGIGDIGTPVISDAVLSNSDSTLTIAGGAVVLNAIDFGVLPFTGVWRIPTTTVAFSVLMTVRSCMLKMTWQHRSGAIFYRVLIS